MSLVIKRQTNNWLSSFGCVIFLFVLIIPSFVCSFFSVTWVYSVISPVIWFLFCREFVCRYKKIGRIILVSLTSIFSIIYLLLSASFYMQGVGFNEQFFFHFNESTLNIVIQHYKIQSFLLIFLWLFSTCYPFFLKVRKKSSTNSSLGYFTLLFLLSLFTYAPGHSLLSFANTQITKTLEEHEVEFQSIDINVVDIQVPPKNLIFLYLESIEQLYFNEKFYPGLLPNLKQLRAQSQNYTNMHQVSQTGWTIAGIVASQCGVPLNIYSHKFRSANLALATIKQPLPDYVCLGDILKAYGYQTVMFKGASLKFSGTNNFLFSHGFNKAKGMDDWDNELVFHKKSGWGIFDEKLFDLAFKEIINLKQHHKRFAFFLVTLDTHHPNGHASDSCPKYKNQNDSLLDAVHCTDFLVGNFLTKLGRRGLLDNVILVFFSDHLAMRNTQWKLLTKHQINRRLTFFVKTDKPLRNLNKPATHFDVAPTVLDYMGIPNFEKMNAGISITKGNAGAWFKEGSNAKIIAKSAFYTGRQIDVKNGFEFSIKDHSLIIDGLKFKITDTDGSELTKHKVYGVIFNDSGLYKGVVLDPKIEEFRKYSQDNFVVVVTKNPKVGKLLGKKFDKGPYYLLYGFPSKKLTLETLWWNVSKSKKEISQLF